MSKEDEAYRNIVDTLKALATAVDEYIAVAPEDKAGWVVGWQEQLEQDFLDFAMEMEPVDSTD